MQQTRKIAHISQFGPYTTSHTGLYISDTCADPEKCVRGDPTTMKPHFSQNLSQKGALLNQNFADDLHSRTWPVFNDALPFCKI